MQPSNIILKVSDGYLKLDTKSPILEYSKVLKKDKKSILETYESDKNNIVDVNVNAVITINDMKKIIGYCELYERKPFDPLPKTSHIKQMKDYL